MIPNSPNAANLLLLIQGNQAKTEKALQVLEKKLAFTVTKYKAIENKNVALEQRIQALEKQEASG